MQSSKLDFTFIALNEQDKYLYSSYLRNTPPDYLLSVHGTGVKFENSDGTKELFPHPVDCSFFLNYGDLFLSAVNVLENKTQNAKCIEWLALELVNAKTKLEVEIKNTVKGETGRVLNSSYIQELNNTYKRYDLALSFAITAFFATYEEEKGDGFFSYALSELLSLPDNRSYSGALSAAEFQENLKKHNLFSEISVTIRYQDNGVEYSFSDFSSLIAYEVRQMIGQNREIKVCENCGRFFIPSNRRDEKYCDNICSGFKTCKQVAFSRRLDNDEALKAYRKIYKTQHARKQRNGNNKKKIEQYFEQWSVFAKNKLSQCQNGEISLEEMANSISGKEWMQGEIIK